MKHVIYICGNYAVLRNGESISCIDCEGAIDQAVEIGANSDIELYIDREFSNWTNGGKHRRYATYSTGFVCTHHNAPAWIKELIDNMDFALREELKKWIAD